MSLTSRDRAAALCPLHSNEPWECVCSDRCVCQPDCLCAEITAAIEAAEAAARESERAAYAPVEQAARAILLYIAPRGANGNVAIDELAGMDRPPDGYSLILWPFVSALARALEALRVREMREARAKEQR